MKNQRLFQHIFPVSSDSGRESLYFLVPGNAGLFDGQPPEQVLEYYGLYEGVLEEYYKNPVLSISNILVLEVDRRAGALPAKTIKAGI